MRNFPSPKSGVFCILIGDLNLKSALVLFTLLNARKRYTEDYWLVYIPNQVGEWSIFIVLYIFFRLNNKRYILCCVILNYDDIFSLNMFFSLIFNQWFLGIFCHNFLKKLKNYLNFDFQYRSTSTFEVSQFLLPKGNKHRTVEQYKGSDDCGELYFKLDVNRPASGKLRKSTTYPASMSDCRSPERGVCLYFYCWYHFKKRRGIVYPFMWKKKPLQKVPCYSILRSGRYMEDCWLLSFYSQNSEGELSILFFLIFVIWNKKRYIMCYCLLTYDDNIILVMFYIKILFIIFFLPNFE